MKKRLLINTNQRIDNPDIQNIIDFNNNEFSIINKNFLSNADDSKNGRVIAGFDFSVSSGITLEVAVEDLVVLTSDGDLAAYLSTQPQLTIALADNATNYIEAQVYTENTELQTKAFWNPLTLTEYTQTVNTVKEKKIRLTVNQTGFTGNIDSIPVGLAITNGGAVERIHDNYQNTVLTGSPSNPTFEQSLFFSLNDDDNDGNSEDFDFGTPRNPKSIKTLEDYTKAVCTQLKHIIGDGNDTGSVQEKWFAEPKSDLFSLNQDRNIFLTGGGNGVFDASGNSFTFDADIKVHLPSTEYVHVIQTSAESPVTVNTTDTVGYIELDRDLSADANTSLVMDAPEDVPNNKDVFIVFQRVGDVLYFANGLRLEDGDRFRDLNKLLIAPFTLNAVDDTTTTPDFTINKGTGDPKIRLQCNNSPSNTWDIYIDNAGANDDLEFDRNGNLAYQFKANTIDDIIVFDTEVPTSSDTPVGATIHPKNMIQAFCNVQWTVGGSVVFAPYGTSTAVESYNIDQGSTTTFGASNKFLRLYFRRNMADAKYSVQLTTENTSTSDFGFAYVHGKNAGYVELGFYGVTGGGFTASRDSAVHVTIIGEIS